ncbi:MAG: FAD-binding protein [Acidimicrobiales bacterium]
MKAIVLVKQVPDVRAAPVGVAPDGTIAREAAPAVTNPADLHALEAALQIAEDVTVVSMGPPRAEEVLRDAISRGADRGVLLCDRAFAGSDTWATANALAAAIEHLGGADLVLGGLTAIDGETGQVGPEVATRLSLPQATGCEALELDGDRLVVRRIVEGGYERLRLPLPALVTVAETGFVPRYPTLPGRRRAAHAELTTLTADDLGLGRDRVGLEASPTKVAHMEPAPLPDRTCRMVGDGFGLTDLVAELRDLGALDGAGVGPGGGIDESTADPEPLDPTTEVPLLWVVCEPADDGDLAAVSSELLTEAGELAPALGGGVGAVCLGDDPAGLVAAASRFGADVVYVARDARLSPYRCQPHARVLVDAIRAHGPAAVLFGATTTGRDLAPRVAALVDAGLAADCTDLTVGPWARATSRTTLLHQIRPAMAGGVLATCVSPTARPQMATVRPHAAAQPHPCRSAVVELAVSLDDGDEVVAVRDREVRTGEVGLADADVIVAGGAGCDAQSWHLVEELADVIGGRVAASRGAVEAGLASRSRQVGQTGATVHPRLYVACGVSGALQHVVGMRAARTVVAVNRDPDAFIFRVASFGVVGDVAEVLPALTEAIRAAR